MFCPECGVNHHADDEVTEEVIAANTVAEVTANEVRIAEINAKKEIALAKIARGIAEAEELHESEVVTAHAQGEADGLREAITPPEVPEPEPIVLPDNLPEPEPAPDTITLADDHQDREPRHRKPQNGFFGL
jgi:hypothetical protein